MLVLEKQVCSSIIDVLGHSWSMTHTLYVVMYDFVQEKWQVQVRGWEAMAHRLVVCFGK